LVLAQGALRAASPVPEIPSYLKGYEKLFAEDPRAAALQWFREAKFGLFIHYGLYSLDGIHPFEQHRLKIPVAKYEKKAVRFTAEKFDAGAFCDLALEAQMKYVTLVTKHCDGFCLWDTKHTAFNSVRSAAKRDLVAEMVAACNQRGLALFRVLRIRLRVASPTRPAPQRLPDRHQSSLLIRFSREPLEKTEF